MASVRKRLATIITLVAFFTATLGPLFPRYAAAAQPCAMMMNMADHHDGSSKPLPMPGCGGDVSCIVMCALPATPSPLATRVVWSGVDYWSAIRPLTGVTLSPDPSPPRTRV